MSGWEQVGAKLRTSTRREVAKAPHREVCDGCGAEVERTSNVLVDRSRTVGTDGRQQPIYPLDAYQSLCSRCKRQHEETA